MKKREQSKKRSRRQDAGIGFQKLEDRKLMAADFGISFGAFEAMSFDAAEIVEVSHGQSNFSDMMGTGFQGQQINMFAGMSGAFGFATPSFGDAPGVNFPSVLDGGDSQSEVDSGDMSLGQVGTFESIGAIWSNFDAQSDFGLMGLGSDAVGEFVLPGVLQDVGFFASFEGEFGYEFENESVFDLNLSDGSDGVVGSLDAEKSSESYTFLATEDGLANIVLSSDLAEGELSIELVDEEGVVVEPTATDANSAFTTFSYEVQDGSVYSVNVSGEVSASAQYQLTVSIEAADPVDIHSDEVGDEATPLNMEFGFAGAYGDLESSGDRDVFQFTASATGETLITANEFENDSELNLSVAVFDANGDQLATGKTNASVSLELATAEGETYFVAVSADEGQAGSYNFVVDSGHQALLPEDGVEAEVGSVEPGQVDTPAGEDRVEVDAIEPEQVDGLNDDVEAIVAIDAQENYGFVRHQQQSAYMWRNSFELGDEASALTLSERVVDIEDVAAEFISASESRSKDSGLSREQLAAALDNLFADSEFAGLLLSAV